MNHILSKAVIYGLVSIISTVGLLLQAKAISYLAGPSGYGVYSTVLALLTLVSTISQWGLSSSLVSFLSKARVEADVNDLRLEEREQVASKLIRIAAAVGLICGSITLYLANTSPVHNDLTLSLAGGAAISLMTLSALNTSILTAGGQVKTYAIIKVSSIALSTLAIIVCYLLMGLKAAVPALLFGSIPLAVLSTKATKSKSGSTSFGYSLPCPAAYSKTLATPRLRSYINLLKTSSAIALSGIGASASSYLVLMLISNSLGSKSVGLFSAALAASIANINFILQAMSLDYFPRLCKVIHDHELSRKQVDQQIQFNLTTGPPFLFILVLMNKEILAALYSPEFSSAAPLVQIFALCGFIRLIQWPMGFLQLAIPLRKLWIITQTLSSVLPLLLMAILVPSLSLVGAAISYLIMYLAMFVIIAYVAHYAIAFRPSLDTVQIALRTFLILIISLILANHVASGLHRLLLVFILGALSSAPSLQTVFPKQYSRLQLGLGLRRTTRL